VFGDVGGSVSDTLFGPFCRNRRGVCFGQLCNNDFSDFLSMATGFASPYLLGALWLGTVKIKLHKPGIWMGILRKILGLLLVLTVGRLIFLLTYHATILQIYALFGLLGCGFF